MPVDLSENSSLDFLGSTHLQALALTGVIDRLFGEVKRPDWFHVVHHVRYSVDSRGTQLSVRVDMLPHRWEADLGPTPRNRKTTRTVGLRVRRSFGVDFAVPEHKEPSRVPGMFARWLEAALMPRASSLYELDPRIGWRHGSRGSHLPRSPLLDPPALLSRSGLPVLREGLNGWESADPPDRPPRCPFCGEPHRWGEAPVWAGGNLRWVHARCWGSS